MDTFSGRYPGALERPGETDHVVGKVFHGLGIKKGPARAASRAPVFADLFRSYRAEIIVELLAADAAQFVLVENGNLPPFLRIVEFVDVDTGEPVLPEGRAARTLHSNPLAFALQCIHFLAVAR